MTDKPIIYDYYQLDPKKDRKQVGRVKRKLKGEQF